MRGCGMREASAFFYSTVVAIMIACQPKGSNRPHTALDSQAQQLRAAFNADSGKVRVVMLASPT